MFNRYDIELCLTDCIISMVPYNVYICKLRLIECPE